MNFEQATSLQSQLAATEKAASAALQSLLVDVERGPMGLTPDSLKQSPEWKQAIVNYDEAKARLRNFNCWYLKSFRRELAAIRRAKYSKPA